jgi:hypothetical protein
LIREYTRNEVLRCLNIIVNGPNKKISQEERDVVKIAIGVIESSSENTMYKVGNGFFMQWLITEVK